MGVGLQSDKNTPPYTIHTLKILAQNISNFHRIPLNVRKLTLIGIAPIRIDVRKHTQNGIILLYIQVNKDTIFLSFGLVFSHVCIYLDIISNMARFFNGVSYIVRTYGRLKKDYIR